MAEYIEREALLVEVTEKYSDAVAGSYPFNIVAYDMARLVKNAPAADVVEVIRCRDCKYGEKDIETTDEWYLCLYHGCDWNYGNHFCSYGERKDDV